MIAPIPDLGLFEMIQNRFEKAMMALKATAAVMAHAIWGYEPRRICSRSYWWGTPICCRSSQGLAEHGCVSLAALPMFSCAEAAMAAASGQRTRL